ncbi:SDH family Clp fold serine proteinase [Pseudodesulfovibrio karagichevae]|uniref:Serine protease n=1 Tax=Pseudodesulfovibrio karagichevae TaxID=3239305 RepID=A0ABV4K7A4_9BACT
MYPDRIALYREIEEARGSKILTYVTGDRPGLETQIHPEVVDYFTDHLDSFGLPIPKISLLLYSRGGVTLAGWSIVNLIRIFCDEFEVIVPSKAHSTATLIAIGADHIVMTKQATLGPIDPSTNGPYNPPIPGGQPNQTLSVSVEDVAGYFELAKGELEGRGLEKAFELLAAKVHPLALGKVYRSRAQIQMLAQKLLKNHMDEEANIKKVISFLCSDSGSHDYTINRREAKNDLKLPIENPDDALYDLIKRIYLDIRDDLELTNPYNQKTILGLDDEKDYSFRRTILESIQGGSHKFVSEGKLRKKEVPTPAGPMIGIEDERNFEGWRHEPAII